MQRIYTLLVLALAATNLLAEGNGCQQYYIPIDASGADEPMLFVCDGDQPASYMLADQGCAQTLATDDPYCVNTDWDVTCLNAYNICAYGCTNPAFYIPIDVDAAGTPMIYACDPGEGVYVLADQACAQTVSQIDTFCLTTDWDGVCVDAYNACVYGCVTPGCINPEACNYDSTTGCDDGSCILPDGCTDSDACNFDVTAVCDDGSCDLPSSCGSCTGNLYSQEYLPFDYNIVNQDMNIDLSSYAGSTVTLELRAVFSECESGPGDAYLNNMSLNGACLPSDYTLEEIGSTDWFITPYWDGCSAAIPIDGCPDVSGTDATLNMLVDIQLPVNEANIWSFNLNIYVAIYGHYYSGETRYFHITARACEPLIEGCDDPAACNYDSEVEYNDGSCLLNYGCMDASACNYDSIANCEDGLCEYLPVFAIIGSVATGVLEEEAYIYNSTAGSTYNWTIESGAIGNGQGTNSVTAIWSTMGEYDLTVVETDSEGCVGEPVTIAIAVGLVGVSDTNATQFELYPNPATEKLNVKLQSNHAGQAVTISLYDTSGKLLIDTQSTSLLTVLDVRDIAGGSYILAVNSATISSRQLVIIE